jgi:hypothetical protein
MRGKTVVLGLLVFSFVLFQVVNELPAEEHPTEYSKEKGEEQSAEHSEEGDKAKKEKGVSKEELAETIKGYVEKDAELKGGYFLVYDKEAQKPLVLKLARVHKDRLSKVAEDVYFACADFETLEGEIYDLDIFMKGIGKDNLKATEISVHKEAGKPRYTWYEEDGIWKKNTQGEKGKKAEPKTDEHPSEHPG